MRSKHSISRKLFVLFAVLSSENIVCYPITNSDLNDHIKEFSAKNDSTNSTGIKTLQIEESERYANFSPIRNPIRFEDVPDSALSSSYSRGLVHHEHPGYSLHEYQESPVYGFEYHAPDPVHHGYDHHGYDHHGPDYHGHGGHHVDYHHKHYDHALAAKAFLWPIAGLALLGAAAALVSNPVLLQLGVVSGKRKRRDTEEAFDTLDSELSWLKKEEEDRVNDTKLKKGLNENREKQRDVNFTDDIKSYDELKHKPAKKHSVKQEALFNELKEHPTVQSPVKALEKPGRFSGNKNIKRSKLIPVPLLLKA